MVLMLAIIEYLRHLCEGIEETLTQWDRADRIVNSWLENQNADSNGMERLIIKNLGTLDEIDPTFIEHLFYRLRGSGRSYVKMLRVVDDQLEKFGTDTAQITQNEHNAQSMSTVSMGNCIASIHFIAAFNGTELFDSVSHVEKILTQDPDGTYPLMDIATRSQYRSRVEELALVLGTSELHVAKKVVEMAQNADPYCIGGDGHNDVRCMRHIGFYPAGQGFTEPDWRTKRQKAKNLATGGSAQTLVGAALLWLHRTGYGRCLPVSPCCMRS